MNLVCFSNNTAGGLVCDLFNGDSVKMDGYKTTGVDHSVFKVLDSPTVQRKMHIGAWNHRVKEFGNSNKWMGTHYHPSAIPNLDEFTRVIAITTLTRNSKLYRWLRYYHGWFKNNNPTWEETDDLVSIDKIRELAKNVFDTFEAHPGCENVEFEDIVNGNFVTENNLDIDQFYVWKNHNPWLYQLDNLWAEKRFNEAEWEIENHTSYQYV